MALYLFGDHPRRSLRPSRDDWLVPSSWDTLASGFPLRPYFDELRSFDLTDGIEKKSFIGKDGFQVSLDVQHFQPNEISVKTENNSVIINAKHEEKEDNHGYISREFTRRYDLPEGFRVEDITSTLSSDGVLTIKAPPPAIEGNVRHVQIQQTGPARTNVGANKEVKNGQ